MSAAFSPDGTRIVTASVDKTARVWRADGSGEPVVLRGHEERVTSAAFSPDGTRIVTGSYDNTARVWRADGSGEPLVLRGHEDAVYSAAFSPDGTRIVTASVDNTARVWRADGSGEPLVLRGHEGTSDRPRSARTADALVTAASDDWRQRRPGPSRRRSGCDLCSTRRCADRGPGSARASAQRPRRHRLLRQDSAVWRADGGGEPLVLRGHEGQVTSAAFSPDGTRVVTRSATTQRASGAPTAAASPWSCAGTRRASIRPRSARTGRASSRASSDETARVWPLVGALEQLAAYARSLKLPRQLTEAQKKQYFIVDDW